MQATERFPVVKSNNHPVSEDISRLPDRWKADRANSYFGRMRCEVGFISGYKRDSSEGKPLIEVSFFTSHSGEQANPEQSITLGIEDAVDFIKLRTALTSLRDGSSTEIPVQNKKTMKEDTVPGVPIRIERIGDYLFMEATGIVQKYEYGKPDVVDDQNHSGTIKCILTLDEASRIEQEFKRLTW